MARLANDIGLRRRGRDIGLRAPLVEREDELSAIEHVLADARDGAGRALVIEAPAGKGKSRLLTIAGDAAREADMQVLGAHASELERDFPFGLALQLFEPRWRLADEDERSRLLEGAARHAGRLLAGDLLPLSPVPDDSAYALIHGLFWLGANLALPDEEDDEPRPLAILVDDLQWADRQSLRFLAYLAARIEELPIALIVAVRTGEELADRQAHAALRRAAAGAVVSPGSLTPEGVSTIVAAVLGDPEPEFAAACAHVTNGNPFLLIELVEQLRRDGAPPTAATGARLTELTPASVLDAVLARLDALPAEARAVAEAVAILGPTSSLALVAAVASVAEGDVIHAADALAALHLFHPGSPLGFVHPLIAQAISASLSPLDQGMLHARAAARLRAQGAPEEQVALHLLATPPAGDADAIEVLRVAAQRALASGDAHSAVRLLQRAVEEGHDHARRPELLAELAQAESAAGLPRAQERLERALEVAEDAHVRARLALTQARVHYEECRYGEAATLISRALADLPDGDPVAEDLEAAYIAAAFFAPELSAVAAERAETLKARVTEPPTTAQLDVLAHMAVHGGLSGASRAAVTAMARAAWANGRLLEAESLDGLSWPLVTGALLYVGELELALEICDRALEAARQQDSPSCFAAASYCRAWPLYEQGQIVQAAVDARAGLDARPDGWRAYLRTAYAAVAVCHLQRGELEQAETALSILEHPGVREHIHLPSLLDARAQLRIAQHRPREALRDALQAGEELSRALKGASAAPVAWRSTAALAKLALGDSSGAQELAAEELEESLRIDVPRLTVRNVRILGLAEGGAAGLDLLAEAVARGNQCPPRLEHVHALVDYGAALRRANRRSAAREPLRRALELAHRGGAAALAQRARTELAAAGGRPRRIMLSGLESLTPSERRVAEMAAQGLTTRQVAEALFVTPKTVEFHLRHVYRKLDVSSRGELAAALREDAAA